MSFEEYWNKHWANVPTETADRTFGEEVWKAAQDARDAEIKKQARKKKS